MKNENFSFQTNFNAIAVDRWRQKFSKHKFTTVLYFLYVDSIEKCKERVAQRFAEGGHNVIETEIISRYNEGLKILNNCFDKYDIVKIIDTSNDENIIIFEWGNNGIEKFNKSIIPILRKHKLRRIIKSLKLL